MREVITPENPSNNYSAKEMREEIPGFFSQNALDLCQLTFKSGLLSGGKDSKSFVEIGVHCGKSFIPLSNLCSEICDSFYAIDVFGLDPENPHATGDSGKKRYLENLHKYSSVPEVTIFQEYSTKITPELLAEIGPIGFASIDGSHSYEDTKNDLELMAANLHKDGVIIVDDVFHQRYIEVVWALQEYVQSQDKIVPWLVGGNKVFFAHADKAKKLYDYIQTTAPFNMYFIKYRLFGCPVIVASTLEKAKVKRKVAYQVLQRYPRLYNVLKNSKIIRSIFKRL